MKNVNISSQGGDRFDRHRWSPSLLCTQEELNTMLASLDAATKRIARINVIGTAKNLSADSLYGQMLRSLSTAVDLSSPLWQETKNRVPIPCTAKICEPVVIVFEDDCTLELRPAPGGLLAACNQISPVTKDGLNHRCFDSEKIFAGTAGTVMKGISLTEQHSDTGYIEKTSWDIHLSGDYDLRLDYSCSGWFDLTLIRKDTGTPAMMTYGEMQRYVSGDDQIHIVEGLDNSSYFRICPVRQTEPTEDNRHGVEEFRKEEISIGEDDVFSHLYYFLNKYFAKDYPYREARPPYCENEFEWSMEYNLYTYETVRAMLDEIEECAHLLISDFLSEKLDGLKNKVCHHPLDVDNDPDFQKLPAEKQEQELSLRIAAAHDFYERFVARMRSMMDSSPEYEAISFMGP